jgi:hypothetical protein
VSSSKRDAFRPRISAGHLAKSSPSIQTKKPDEEEADKAAVSDALVREPIKSKLRDACIDLEEAAKPKVKKRRRGKVAMPNVARARKLQGQGPAFLQKSQMSLLLRNRLG